MSPVQLLRWGVVALGLCATCVAQEPAADESSLTLEQQSLAARFERLEAIAAKLAEVAAETEPQRAEQLRAAIRTSRELGTRERFTAIVELLQQEQLSAAARGQNELQEQLEQLLNVLLEDPTDDGREKLKEQLRQQIREIGKMIRQQRSLRSQNEAGREADPLADEQAKLAELAEKLEAEMKNAQAKPSDAMPSDTPPATDEGPSDQPSPGESQEGESPPSQPAESQPPSGESPHTPPGASDAGEPQSQDPPPADASQRLEAARQAMREAEQKLRDAERDQAADKQRDAQRELEAARAELERLLRQLREEEVEQLLTQLAARLREMLSLQKMILDETKQLAAQTSAETERTRTLQAVRLSRRESELVNQADRALVVIREDGTSVAFSESLEQIRADMQSVVGRLAAAEVDELTQTIEADIVAALEDAVAALDEALDELAQKQAQPAGQGQAGEPGEPPLVSQLAELRMIRTLQARINSRTLALDRILQAEPAQRAELADQLEELARRQQRVFEATRDLDSGRHR